MPSPDAAEIQSMIDEFGEEVALGSETVKALVDAGDAPTLQGEGGGAALITRPVFLTIKRGALSALASGASIIWEGTALKVRSFLHIEDGELTRIECVKAAR